MNPDQLLDAMRSLQVRVREYPGWRSRRAKTDPAATFDPHALVVHDSVTGSMSDQRAAEFCIAGRSDVPGPLYACLVGRDGTAHLIAFGKTNNAGRGAEDRYRQAAQGRMPLDRELQPVAGGWGGANDRVHGITFVTYGAGPYTDVQVDAGARVLAAYCRAENWGKYGATSIIGHSEFTNRKIDPQLDMGMIRSRVNGLLTGSREVWYVTVPGDTLWGIAIRHHTSVEHLKAINSFSGDVIGIGWRVRVR